MRRDDGNKCCLIFWQEGAVALVLHKEEVAPSTIRSEGENSKSDLAYLISLACIAPYSIVCTGSEKESSSCFLY